MRSVLVVMVLAGCSSTKDDCMEDQVEVTYAGGPRDGETVCHPRPAACGARATCTDTPCVVAMFEYCESPYMGVACSDAIPPPLITCD